MYRIAIIDDEQVIRQGLAEGIPWRQEGFEVVGVAADGLEGERLIQTEKPDIVLCDIKMPHRDGIELVRRLREQGASCKILMMTGFEEFEYAKAALDLKVDCFLLKPIDDGELLHTVRLAARLIEQERRTSSQMERSRQLLRQQLLWRVLTGQLEQGEALRDELRELGLPFEESDCLALLCRLSGAGEAGGVVLQSREAARLSLLEGLRQALAPLCALAVYPGLSDGFVLALYTARGEGPAKALQQRCEEFCTQSRGRCESGFNMSLGSWRPGCRGLAQSYEEAVSHMRYRHLVGKNTCITDEKVRRLSHGQSGQDVRLELELVERLRLGQGEEAQRCWQELLELYRTHCAITLDKTRVSMLRISETVLTEYESLSGESGGPLRDACRQLGERLFALFTVEEIFEVCKDFLDAVLLRKQEYKLPQSTRLLHQALRYVQQHYQDPELSLGEVAAQTFISPSYLGALLKREMDTNFSEYLTEYRICRAQELIRNTNLKLGEVAQRCGYSNPQYFALCFRRKTGVTPSQYKNL